MPDFGNPFGVDLATMLFGSGLSLVLSAGVMRYGDRIADWTNVEVLGTIGIAFLVVGGLLGLVLVGTGRR